MRLLEWYPFGSSLEGKVNRIWPLNWRRIHQSSFELASHWHLILHNWVTCIEIKKDILNSSSEASNWKSTACRVTCSVYSVVNLLADEFARQISMLSVSANWALGPMRNNLHYHGGVVVLAHGECIGLYAHAGLPGTYVAHLTFSASWFTICLHQSRIESSVFLMRESTMIPIFTALLPHTDVLTG